MQFDMFAMQEHLPAFFPDNALNGLASLVHLKLEFGHSSFDRENARQLDILLARVTPQLTHLDLSKNSFSKFPSGIIGLIELRYLDISWCPLRLDDSFSAVVKSLSQLCILKMKKPKLPSSRPTELRSREKLIYTWDPVSLSLIESIREDLPGLDLQI